MGKEDELKALKAELATLDQKITAELAPKQEKQDFGEAVKHEEPPQHVNHADVPTQSIGGKETMVAEPPVRYRSFAGGYVYKRIGRWEKSCLSISF